MDKVATKETSLPTPTTIGPYQIQKKIAMGGMGEVFEAFDPICRRKVALKRIRQDKSSHAVLHKRFLKEAYMAAQLSHPAIIPIYAIHEEPFAPYYVMPLIEGWNLKDLLRSKISEQYPVLKEEDRSIPSLMPVFMTLCRAIAYAHFKGYLHRDIKPENVLLGKYGQVFIVDWGLVKKIDDQTPEEEGENFPFEDISFTHPGKILGTLAYMAPERVDGTASSVKSDLYSLGAILYQILTLKLPFHRPSVEQFRKNLPREILPNPIKIAPYRDIPEELARICQRCLEPLAQERYHNVDELIEDLQHALLGRPQWIHLIDLDLKKKQDWEFQENIFIATDLALLGQIADTQWMGVMISQTNFTGDTAIETKVKIGPQGTGIGLLLGVPNHQKRKTPLDGYCLWLSANPQQRSKLLKSAVEVVSLPHITLKRGAWISIRFEKNGHQLNIYNDGILLFSYLHHLPLDGTHVGLLYRDQDFEIDPLQVFVQSMNLTVSCLAIPDAFFAAQDFQQALTEYRRIATTFKGRVESRQAMLRAGLTLLEQAKTTPQDDYQKRFALFDQALLEFENLKNTPAPLFEYLGKSLVYQAMHDTAEEANCLELALCKWPKHPLLHIIQEQVLFRMHETSSQNRIAAYRFAWIAVRHLKNQISLPEHSSFFERLSRQWHTLDFLKAHKEHEFLFNEMEIPLAFLLHKTVELEEMALTFDPQSHPLESGMLCNILFSLFYLGRADFVCEEQRTLSLKIKNLQEGFKVDLAIHACCQGPSGLQPLLSSFKSTLTHWQQCALNFLAWQCYRKEEYKTFDLAADTLKQKQIAPSQLTLFHAYYTFALLKQKRYDEARRLIKEYFDSKYLKQDPFYFLHGCNLASLGKEEAALSHFALVSEESYPPQWAIFAHFISHGELKRAVWLKNAFWWEKEQLKEQFDLYNSCNLKPLKELSIGE